VRVSRGRTGTVLARHLSAALAAVLAATTMLVTTPWDEPVTAPDQVRVEDALSILRAGLAVMFIATAIGLVAAQLTAVRTRWVAAIAALAALAARTGEPLGLLGLIGVPVAATLAVTAATRDVSPTRLLIVGVSYALALPPAVIGLYFAGTAVGAQMTSLAGNPPVNGADTDLSIAFIGVALGLLLASISYVVTLSSRPPDSVSRHPDSALALRP
jgi:hypothetical protein